jgi:plasmid stabilization system protein ParE
VAAALRIGTYPQMGVRRPALAPEDVRFLVVPDFQFVIVYRATATPPRILRVLHGARDPQDALCGMFGET